MIQRFPFGAHDIEKIKPWLLLSIYNLQVLMTDSLWVVWKKTILLKQSNPIMQDATHAVIKETAVVLLNASYKNFATDIKFQPLTKE